MQIFADGLPGQPVPVDTDRFELIEHLKLKLQVCVCLSLHPLLVSVLPAHPRPSQQGHCLRLLAHTSVCAAQDATGVPAAHLRVSHAGRQLSDGCQLADYNISQDAVVHLTLRLWCDLFGTCSRSPPVPLIQAP